MKIFTFGRVVRLGLIGGGIYYVRKHGGPRAVWNKLVAQVTQRADEVKDKVKDQVDETKSPKATTESPMRPIYHGNPSGYTGG